MGVVLDQKDAADWVYRGEGALNLVLAYTGSSSVFVGKVMRIKKVPRSKKPQETVTHCVNGSSVLDKHERLIWKDEEELVSASDQESMGQAYAQHVMSPLLGPKHVDAGVRVLVTREFLESVRKNVSCQRPASRANDADVDTHCGSVLLLSDHTVFPEGIVKCGSCIAVEIKPKCGFLPISPFISEENAIKRSITRFRLHQALKLHEEEISELSGYDPLDLFSGSKARMCKALTALYTAPQNNFRVFLSGSLIIGGLGGSTGNTSAETGEDFEDALKCVIQADNGLRRSSFIQLVSEAVCHSGVLDRLLEVQKLDNCDIEGTIHAYYNIISQPCKVCGKLDEMKVSNPCKSLHSITLDESLKIVKDYLIAATAKDCSLMLCFRPTSNEVSGSSYNSVYLESTNQFFDYKVNFIDLDLKSLKKMEEYYEKDKNIVSCYIKKMEQCEKDKKNSEQLHSDVNTGKGMNEAVTVITYKNTH